MFLISICSKSVNLEFIFQQICTPKRQMRYCFCIMHLFSNFILVYSAQATNTISVNRMFYYLLSQFTKACLLHSPIPILVHKKFHLLISSHCIFICDSHAIEIDDWPNYSYRP